MIHISKVGEWFTQFVKQTHSRSESARASGQTHEIKKYSSISQNEINNTLHNSFVVLQICK